MVICHGKRTRPVSDRAEPAVAQSFVPNACSALPSGL